MKFAWLCFILAVLPLYAQSADYPRPQFSGKKTPSDFSKLPQALLSEGQPVDPFCVERVLTQARGTSVALTECAGTAKDVQRYMMYTSNAEKKAILAEATIDNQKRGYLETCTARYEVQGVLDKKAIVKTQYKCKDSYAEHMALGIIEQKNNLLINGGVLSLGDRCKFGYSYVESLEKGILRYRVMSPASQLLNMMLNHSPEDKFSLLKPDYLDDSNCFGWVRLTLDLNKNEDPFKPKVSGVIFKRPLSLGYTETTTKNCLSKTIDKFITNDDASVPAEKFSAFRTEVNKCTGPQPVVPEAPEESQRIPGLSI